MSLRVFAALEVPGEVLDALAAFQAELSRTGADLKLVERENLHFTVRFLGEVSEEDAAEAKARLGALSVAGGTAQVRGVGAFPDLARPRVVWAGVAKGDEEKVVSIARAAADALAGIGEADTRPFVPHLTVARVRSGRNASALSGLVRLDPDRSFGAATFAELKLKSSRLTPGGPVYSDLGVFPLK